MMDQLTYDKISHDIDYARRVIDTQRKYVTETYQLINKCKGSPDAMERLIAAESALNEAALFLGAAFFHFQFDAETSGSVKGDFE